MSSSPRPFNSSKLHGASRFTFSTTARLLRQETDASAMASFVLVHGSFHGAWCWRKVAPLLRARGHDAWTPTLTGFGDRSHLGAGMVDLRLHCRDVVETLETEDVREAMIMPA